MQPQSRRGRNADRGAEENGQAGADGLAAALLAAHHRDRGQDPQRLDRPRLLRKGLVQQRAQVDWHRQRSSRAAAVGLGPLPGASTTPGIQGQRTALQLALVQDLGHRGIAQQWHARSRRLPLGIGRGLSQQRCIHCRAISVQGRLAVLRHHEHQLRLRRRDDLLGREVLQRDEVLRSRPRCGHHRDYRHCSRRSRRLRDLRLEGQDDCYVQGRQQDRCGGPGRPRLDDGRPLRKLYRGHSEGREAEAARRTGQRRRDHVATLEHRLGDEA